METEKQDIQRGVELAIKGEQNVQQYGDVSSSWGAAEALDSQDCEIGRIMHQQALSKLVQDSKAAPGDWCDSNTNEVLCVRDKPFEIIIFHSFKKLIISRGFRGDKFEYVESQDVTPANANLPWEEDLGSQGIIKRNLQYNYFCLLPNKIQEFPYLLSFMSTKIKAAKKLNTMIAKLAKMQRPSANCVFELHSKKEVGDKGSWYGVEVRQGRVTHKNELESAKQWYDTVKKSTGVKVAAVDSHEEDMPF